ncbi:MAG: nucleotidyltransferase family protein [Rhodospirillales bacterium]|nr:nucleotidyltransferase family protein [Rhodospirillales bacterium]
MKALILAGGRGKRLKEHSQHTNKCMVEIGGRNVINFSLDCACHDSIDEVVLIVGYRAEEIINTFGISYKGKRISYVIQREQKGLVHAIECAKEALDGHDFMLLLGDEIYTEPRHDQLIKKFKDESLFVACGMTKVEDRNLISNTYSALFDEDDTIQRLIEKPNNPPNDMMGTGSCAFKNEIFDYIDATPVHHLREEKELPDLIQCVIDDGKPVKLFNISKQYININMIDDLEGAYEMIESSN